VKTSGLQYIIPDDTPVCEKGDVEGARIDIISLKENRGRTQGNMTVFQ